VTHTQRQRLRLVLLRTFARLTRSPVPRPLPSAPRILVIRPDHLGDLLFTTPALRVLRQHHPDARITALVGPWGAAVLSNNPHVDEVVALPFPGFSRRPKLSPWQPYGLLHRWARRLRGGYDLAFILRFDHWWGALLAYLAGVPQRVGYAVSEDLGELGRGVASFLNCAVLYSAGRHEVEQNLRLVDWKSVDWESANWAPQNKNQFTNLPIYHPLEFHIPKRAAAWAGALFQTNCPIAIHPGAGAAVKLWRVERWAAVADALTDEVGVKSQGDAPRIVLTGSQAERSLCLEIAGQMKAPARVMAGETTLGQLAALFSRCRMVLGPDSGPLHLAVAVGTPTVHLYGPVDRATFGPWGPPERHRALVSAWPCIPCNRLDYGSDALAHHPCVREIGVNEVLTAAHQALVA
jgi:ADP-heptose:LPS heptosyltransferase